MRQSIGKPQKQNNSTLLPAIGLLQHQAINRTVYSAVTTSSRNPSEQQVNKPSLLAPESQIDHDLTEVPVRLNSLPFVIQAKLTIGQQNDRYEQEADWVAEQVMHMPGPGSSVFASANTAKTGSATIQRTCRSCANEFKAAKDEQREIEATKLCSQGRSHDEGLIQTKVVDSTLQRQQDEIEEQEERLQTQSVSRQTPTVTPGINAGIQTLRSGGQPMTDSERGFFEPRFGVNFSQVRLHSDTRSAAAARSVNARAFTLGHDIVFNTGEYLPNSLAGRKLLAHELTHVVQQNRATTPFSSNKFTNNTVPNRQEFGIVSSEFFSTSPLTIQRQKKKRAGGGISIKEVDCKDWQLDVKRAAYYTAQAFMRTQFPRERPGNIRSINCVLLRGVDEVCRVIFSKGLNVIIGFENLGSSMPPGVVVAQIDVKGGRACNYDGACGANDELLLIKSICSTDAPKDKSKNKDKDKNKDKNKDISIA